MARPKKDPSKEPTKDRLLRAAEEVFGTKGYHGANLEEIADAVGIRRPSLLYHFEDKATLYKAVVRAGFKELRMAVMTGIAHLGTFEERITAITEELVGLADKRRALIQIFARELVDASEESEPVFEEMGELVNGLAAFLEAQGGDQLRTDIPIRASTTSSK